MRIGIFDPYLDDLGGGEKYMMLLATSLSEKHSVDVFWDKKEDTEALRKRFHLPGDKVQICPNIFSSKVSFFERAKISRTQ
jgi:hypothetical protein